MVKDCENVEHRKPCESDEYCEYCGLTTCSPNFAYHICVKSRTDIDCRRTFCKIYFENGGKKPCIGCKYNPPAYKNLRGDLGHDTLGT